MLSIIFVVSGTSAFAEWEYQLSNTNYLIGSRTLTDDLYDYNRFRLEVDWFSKHVDAVVKIDNENVLGHTYIQSTKYQVAKAYEQNLPIDVHHYLHEDDGMDNRMYLYRAFATLHLGRHDVKAGLQRVPFGVGRIWTPTDVFNPLNALSLEQDERVGVTAMRGEFHPGDMTRIEVTGSVGDEWTSDKAAIRVKSFIEKADVALSVIYSDDESRYGYELEGNLGDTGMEIRSEGAYVDRFHELDNYVMGMIGFDYGFENSLTVAGEYLYHGAGYNNKDEYDMASNRPGSWVQLGKHYAGVTLSYQWSPLLTLNVAAIQNLSDSSFFMSPSIMYSLSDNISLSAGYQYFHGANKSEFNYQNDRYYASVSAYF